MRGARPVLALAIVLALTGCAERAAGAPEPSDPAPTAAVGLPDDGLVLQAGLTGGFTTPETALARLPIASVHADGRVFVEGPVIAIYPAPAWPNVQVVEIGRERVQELVGRALAAGVTETFDLGMPPLADVPSTRFTLVTDTGTAVREVYGLTEAVGTTDSGLTEAQESARAELRALLDELTGLAVGGPGDPVPQRWTPAAVSALVRPWTPPADDVLPGGPPPPVPWPGPALPGTQVGSLPDLSCVTATGEQAAAVIEAAREATVLTPWLSPDGSRWSLTFRPLLPHEEGCADLVG